MEPTRDSPRLSLCMIVRNEVQNLGRCLASVRPVVDEIIVADTGSTDATPQLAAEYGATVVHVDWHDDFAQARNAGLELANGDWFLMLDADEELPPRSGSQIRRLIGHPTCDAYQLRVRNFLPVGELQKWEDMPCTRLFRNRPQYRYEQPIHEQIRPVIVRHGGCIEESDTLIWHYGYMTETVQGRERRAARNLRLLQLALASAPDDPYLHFQLGATYQALGNRQLAAAHLLNVLAMDCRTLRGETIDKVHMKLAQLALAEDRFEQAITYAEASLARNPDNVISLYVSALSNMYLGQIDQAYRQFQRIRNNPGADLANVSELNAVLYYLRETMLKTAG